MVPEVSVVIPSRDRPDAVRRAVDSVHKQGGVDLEVVVVDDGSGTEAAEALAALQAPGTRVVRHEVSRRPAGARNAGIDAAAGEWVAFLDDDDFWAPNKLRCQLDALERADARWAWSGAAYVTPEGELLYVDSAPSPEKLRRQIPSGTVVPAGSSNVIASRELLHDVQGFDERIFHMPDWDLWQRLLLADSGVAHDEPHVAYVQHKGMLSHTHSDVLPRDVAIIKAKLRRGGLTTVDAETDREMLKWYAESHIGSGHWLAAARTFLRSGLRHRRPDDVLLGLGSLGGRRSLERVTPIVERRLASIEAEHAPPPPPPPVWLDAVFGAPKPRAGA